MIKIIVGLGNPGLKYYHTRHNIGFDFLDFIAQKYSISFKKKFDCEFGIYVNNIGEKVIFIKPLTFMNKSGEAVRKVVDFYKISVKDIILVFDDLDLREGNYKLQFGKFPKIHNGVNSVISHLDSVNFYSIRIGVDGRNTNHSNNIQSKDYLLSQYNFNYLLTFQDIFLKINSEFFIFV